MSGHAPGPGPSRRQFIVMGAGLFTVSVVGLRGRNRMLVRRTVPVMGTLAEVSVVSRNPRAAHDAISAALDELYRVERAMSRFDPLSEVGRANRGAAMAPVPVGPATAEVIEAGLRWAAVEGSAFDPCLGRVTELWDVAHRTEPPPSGELVRLAGRRLHRAVRVERGAGGALVAFDSPDVALDLGGIAKGYAVDRAVAALRDWGITDALVNAGGDLYAMGTAEQGRPWTVGVRSPDDPRVLVRTLPLSDGAVATSGDYEQFFEHGGHRYHHLLDPATAAPRQAARRSVTVVARSCMEADAAATAVFGMTARGAAEVLRRAGTGARVLEHA
jgi:FAD:protein FMN transferase